MKFASKLEPLWNQGLGFPCIWEMHACSWMMKCIYICSRVSWGARCFRVFGTLFIIKILNGKI
jgi:hypothetical protein